MPGLRIGIDTGGTFTDVAVLEGRRLRIHKVPSTPHDPAEAVLLGLGDVRGATPVDVVHGSTVGLNAVLTGNLARTALVTNTGFRDLCEIGRQDRLDLYALAPSRTTFPVPRSLRFELDVRRDAAGKVLRPLDLAAVDALAARLAKARVEAVAVCLLHSHRAPADERAVARRLRAALGVPVTCSADLLPRQGEFERFAAATVNAAILPVMGAYLRRLRGGVRPGTLRLMRSSGGAMSTREAVEYPARAAFSGPAGGIVASGLLAARLGVERMAAFDMGGTSTDVALVGPEPAPSETDRTLGGLPLALPSFDVHTVGCGGGSLAYADTGGALRVGPESAGADPGPACYGKGDEPTVTDAHVVLGHIGAETLLGGSMRLDVDRAVQAVERLAAKLGTDVARCAEGILEVAEIAMMRALLVITSQRAVDPARVPLLAYGGAGGLHAAGLASRLRMPFAAVPAAPGAFSAVGLALAPEASECLQAVLIPLARLGVDGLRMRASALAAKAAASLPPGARTRVEVLARYAGQGAGLWIPLARRDPARDFAERHRARFGFTAETPIEIVEIRARATGRSPRFPDLAPAVPSGAVGSASVRRSPLGRRVRTLRRAELGLGAQVPGPVLVEEDTSVVRIPVGWTGEVTETALLLRPNGGADRRI